MAKRKASKNGKRTRIELHFTPTGLEAKHDGNTPKAARLAQLAAVLWKHVYDAPQIARLDESGDLVTKAIEPQGRQTASMLATAMMEALRVSKKLQQSGKFTAADKADAAELVSAWRGMQIFGMIPLGSDMKIFGPVYEYVKGQLNGKPDVQRAILAAFRFGGAHQRILLRGLAVEGVKSAKRRKKGNKNSSDIRATERAQLFKQLERLQRDNPRIKSRSRLCRMLAIEQLSSEAKDGQKHDPEDIHKRATALYKRTNPQK